MVIIFGSNLITIEAYLLIFFLALGLNLLWWLSLSSSILFYRNRDNPARLKSKCSLIIPYRNEAQNLERLLPILNEQEFDEGIEIIFVDDRSSDGVKELIDRFSFRAGITAKSLRVEELPKGISGKKNAINLGIENASNGNILLLDADSFPNSRKWLRNMNRGLESKDIVLGISNYEQKPGILNQLIQLDTFLTGIQYLGWAFLGLPYMALGRNWGYKKDLFIKQGGFKGTTTFMGGDDDLLFQKLKSKRNWEVRIEEESRTSSVPEKSFSAWFRQKLRHLNSGKGYGLGPIVLSLTAASNHFFLISLLGLLIFSCWDLSIAWPWILIRYLFVILFLFLVQKRIGNRVNPVWFPILEPIYWLFHLAAFFASLPASDLKWKENFQVRH